MLTSRRRAGSCQCDGGHGELLKLLRHLVGKPERQQCKLKMNVQVGQAGGPTGRPLRPGGPAAVDGYEGCVSAVHDLLFRLEVEGII